MSCMQHCAKD